MKPFSFVILCVLFSYVMAHAQNETLESVHLSAATLNYVQSVKTSATDRPDRKFVYTQVEGKRFVRGFIKVNNNIDESKLIEVGVKINTKAGNIWTVQIPEDRVSNLVAPIEGIEAVQLDQPVFQNMSAAREKTNVDDVHNGVELPQSYTGKGVVVGVIDAGFDYTHPTFYGKDGSGYRVKRVWEQKREGTPPVQFGYGHEMTDSMEMFSRETDLNTTSHGTHVAGIAAGSGAGVGTDDYKGVAYESDLVFVGITPPQDQWLNTGMADIVDAVSYIFNYAESVGKPAVANLSWGCSIGPHDGSSLFSQAIDNLTGEGRVFVLSAGNNGENNIHLYKEFSETDTVVQSAIKFSSNLPTQDTWIDIWGETGQEFCIQFQAFNGSLPGFKMGKLCLENNTIDTFLVGSDTDTFFFSLTTVTSDINGKPHALLDIHNETSNSVALSIIATSGSVHVWMGYVLETIGYYGEFTPTIYPWSMAGNTNYTIGEMGCTRSAITVGAYASKNMFTNFAGQVASFESYVETGDVVPFSSEGPTSDGRVKPDITAPGMTLASAVSSYDSRYQPGGVAYGNVVRNFEDDDARTYAYAESSGTSMSAPMVSGIVALALEADPELTPADLKDLMSSTALTDEYTTEEPNSAKWGPGKIDAHAILSSLVISGVEDISIATGALYPNPVSYMLYWNTPEAARIEIHDIAGRLHLRRAVNTSYVSLASLEAGLYVVSLYAEDGALVLREKVVRR